MDPSGNPEDVQALLTLASGLAGYGPYTVVWLSFLYMGKSWWSSVVTHLCRLIPEFLAIFSKFADSGFAIQLRVTIVDGDAPLGKANTAEVTVGE